MKKIYCDICGKEIKNNNSITDFLNRNSFYRFDDEPIDDMCEECFKIIYCCIKMMKETGWKPDFHEVLESDSAWTREKADYKLSDLEDKTGLKLF